MRQVNPVNITRTLINGFILVAICISLFQQLTKISDNNVTTSNGSSQQLQLKDRNYSLEGKGDNIQYPSYDDQEKNSLNIPPLAQKMPNIVIKVTEKLDSQLKTLLATQGYNIQVKPYEFQGNQWWFNIILNYGHIIVMWFMLSKYKTQTNDSNKKKIMVLGFILVFGWMIVSGMMKPQRLSIQYQNKQIYINEKIVKLEIIEKIAEFQDLNDFQF